MAIPASLLNMTATLYQCIGHDDFGKPSYGSAIPLSGVYYEKDRGISIGQLGFVEGSAMTLYFDAENSAPLGTLFGKLDKIMLGDQTFFVKRAVPFHDPRTDEFHHWEVQLDGN